jgi:acyl-CoA hydrolase
LPMLDLEAGLRALRRLRPGPLRLYVAGCSGDVAALVPVLRGAPELARDVTFLGVWIPGVNLTDWSALHATARAETVFLMPPLHAGFASGRTAFRPMHYTDSWDWLAGGAADAGVVMVAPPDARGEVSLGVSADFSGAVLACAGVPVLAVINPAMPAPVDTVRIPLSRFDVVCTDERLLVTLQPGSLPASFALMGAQIAALVGTAPSHLQFGLGSVQQAVLAALSAAGGPANIQVHSGMVTGGVLDLMASGRIPETPGAIVTGVMLGTERLYAAAMDRRFQFRPVNHTHAIVTLAALPRFIAINSVLEVDLLGNANAETLNGRQVSGIGGLVNFLRGAAASPEGLAIVALASTAQHGAVSRIVPRLPQGATSIARTDIDIVVTEHGTARLKGLDCDARAAALIAVADPVHRTRLSTEWKIMRASL